ncbi:hypothetical protein CERZMDRAFT_90474 [Cercospora zeae-maydis SCOH1-5]|uniref:Hydrophobin n=1 Tax=Cercospora zeae-maydis SCOH1-5 TaxID=717836 RepID=A0A6A6FJ64_9PEZI|nr:hypothetical protein CERZMDRAFT_90474 [Cercospora zeae-maydis SCOH1-5]
MLLLIYLVSSIALCLASLSRHEAILCPTELYTEAQCCATNEEGIEDLHCAPVEITFQSVSDFGESCEGNGLRARCCVASLAGQPLVCQNPSGL